MPCYFPLEAWRGPRLPSGKSSIVFKRPESTGALFSLKLPCGQCIGCRLEYSRQWAFRCLAEKQMHKESCFVTCTLDDDHLPSDQSLDKRTWQDFIRELRRVTGKKIRYYHAGEYGERYGRPHYHALLFGVDFADRQFLFTSDSGARVDTSKFLSSVWKKGFCTVGDVTFESAAYVARYCLKKVTGDLKEVVDESSGLKPYERVDVVSGEVRDVLPEYVTMSRRPGIAKSWYEKYKADVYPAGVVVLRGGIKMAPPRYFDGQYELENEVDMKRIKLLRSARSNRREVVFSDVLQKNQKLDVNRADRLAVMHEVKLAELKGCKKKL